MKEASDLDVQRAINRVNMALLESDVRALKKQTSKLKSRSKASDTSRINPVYKPKASPGPASNTLNLYGAPKPNFSYSAPGRQKQAKRPDANRANVKESRLPKKTPDANRANARENRVSNGKPKAKPAKNIAGFKPGTLGYKAAKTIKGAGKDLKKAYQGK